MKYIERHQDYVLNIPSLPAGEQINDLPLLMDTDAPFLCRMIGVHIAPDTTTREQTAVQSCSFRFKNQAGGDLSQQLIQAPIFFAAAYGQNGLYRPIRPQQPYPQGGVLLVDVVNNGGTDITDMDVMFRGVKLFAPGTIQAPTYPPKIRPLDFTYQTGKGTPNDPPLILQVTDSQFQIPFFVDGDADFVLRAGQLGNWDPAGFGGAYSVDGYTQLLIQLMDSQLKPYSNRPFSVDWFFGNAGGSTLDNFTNLGNAAPGLLFPEIYIPRNNPLYFNLFRQDAPYAAVTDNKQVRLSIAWIGSKIYS